MNDLVLIDSGRPVAAIAVERGAAPSVRHAAGELQHHLEAISGARLPIVEELRDEKPAIFLGRSRTSDRLLENVDWAKLGEDGCVVRRVGNHLILSGGMPRGVLYAVYEFLESQLGCRWLTPRCSVIPKRSTVRLDKVDITHVSPFRYREPYFSVAFDADWGARNRANGQHYPLEERHGGKWTYAGFVHTFYPLLPPEQHFADHPEYYSEVEGARIQSQGQLCLTNPEVIDFVTQSARKLLLQQPGARIVSISQNDWDGHCQCRECRRVDAAEGSPAGSLIRFVNAIAERLEAEFPQVLFDTLAYTYTIDPPRQARPRRNVIVRLCHMSPCCDGHSLEACELNRSYVDILHRWCAIAPEVFVWDYFNNFHQYFMPFPNLDAICADLPLYARSGVTGVFCQGDGGPWKGCGDMAELRAYLLARLLWRPESDGRAIIDEFLNLYYGAAAEPIRDYLEMLHRPLRGQPVHFHLYSPLDAPFLEPPILKKANELFDEAARRVKGDDELLDRVAAARLPVDYVQWKRRLKFAIQGNRYVPEDRQEAERAKRFFAVAMSHGAKALREGGRPIEEEAPNMQGFEVLTLERGGVLLAVAPALGGRILSLTDRASGSEWLHQGAPTELDYPCAGGYEEYSEARWRSLGWSERYRAQATEDAIRLTAELASGVAFDRLYRLEESGRAGVSLVIESTLRNPAGEPKRVMIRTHPELNLGDPGASLLLVREAGGKSREIAPWRENDSGDLWLADEQLPAGGWSLKRGSQSLAIEFVPTQVSQCLIGWDSKLGIVRLEVFGRLTDLAAGESVSFRQRWTLAGA